MKKIPFEKLQIIGYADTVSINRRPIHVAPVFQHIEQKSIYYPPYAEEENNLINYIHVADWQFEADVDDCLCTKIKSAIKAKSNTCLWVNADDKIKYESKESYQKDIKAYAQKLCKDVSEQMQKAQGDREKLIQLSYIIERARFYSPNNSESLRLQLEIYEKLALNEETVMDFISMDMPDNLEAPNKALLILIQKFNLECVLRNQKTEKQPQLTILTMVRDVNPPQTVANDSHVLLGSIPRKHKLNVYDSFLSQGV